VPFAWQGFASLFLRGFSQESNPALCSLSTIPLFAIITPHFRQFPLSDLGVVVVFLLTALPAAKSVIRFAGKHPSAANIAAFDF
jgi:hypothetical protein